MLFCNVDVVSSLLTLSLLLDHRSDPHLLRDQEGLIIVVCGVFSQFTKYVSLELCLFRAVELDCVANVGLWRHSGGLVGHLHKRTVTPPPSPPPQSPPQSYNTQKDFYSCEPATTTIGNTRRCKESIWIVSRPFLLLFPLLLTFCRICCQAVLLIFSLFTCLSSREDGSGSSPLLRLKLFISLKFVNLSSREDGSFFVFKGREIMFCQMFF